MSDKTVLWSYFRSSCAWRVRIALNLKLITYEYAAIDLMKGVQYEKEYAAMNPTKTVPTLLIDGHIFRQSVAIMEYLEETRPSPSLFPSDPILRSRVRQIVNIIACDTQPIQNRRVLQKIGEKSEVWARHWIEVNFDGLERVLKESSGKFCVGDILTLADVCLVPQVGNAVRYSVNMTKYPIISRINAMLEKIPEINAAHPRNQPDKPEGLEI